MEERILDKEEGRGIRIKRTLDGETDAVEGTEDDEVAFEFPEEYDESLAGMSQAQVDEELRRREKAREEALETFHSLLSEGNALLGEEKFEEAEEKFAQATVYDADSEEAALGLFAAATKNFTDTERLYSDDRAEDIGRLRCGREIVCERLGERLREEQRAYREEAEQLEPVVEEAQNTRREAFFANRRHYIILTCVSLFLVAAFAIATAISADNIFKNSNVPLVLTIVFGAATFAAVTMLAVFGARLIGANRLCRINERLTSTKDGTRLEWLRSRLSVLDGILKDQK